MRDASDPAPVLHLRQATRLSRRILADRLSVPEDEWRLRLVQRRGSHGGSLVFAARRRGEEAASFAVKLFARPDHARAEFRAAAAARGSAAAVAEPVGFDPEAGIVVSRWVEGETMGALVRRPGAAAPVAACGRWLRAFHRPLPARPVSARRVLLQRLAAARAEPIRPGPEREAWLRAAEALAQRIGAMSPGWCWPVRIHGDFLPQNLILSGRSPVGVDLCWVRAGSRHLDLARMTIHLLLLPRQRGLPSDYDGAALRHLFLRAYGLRGGRARHWLEAAEAVEILVRWASFCREDTWHRRQAGRDLVRALAADRELVR